MTSRVCSTCSKSKTISAFYRNGKNPDGTVAYRMDCKECYNIVRAAAKGRRKLNKFLNNTKHRSGEIATLTFKDWRDALLHFRGCCSYCGVRQHRRMKLTKEHVVPVSKGGLTTRQNIIPVCASCNSSKSDTPLVEWFVGQVFYSAERMEAIKQWIST